MKKQKNMKSEELPKGHVIVYRNKVEVRLDRGLTQKHMSDLFDIERSVITKHIHSVFKTKELEEKRQLAHRGAEEPKGDFEDEKKELPSVSSDRNLSANPSPSPGSVSSAIREPGVKKEKIGRNDPCPCGSGKKYKKCCGR